MYRLRELDVLATLFGIMSDVSTPEVILPFAVDLVMQLIAIDVRSSDLQQLCDVLLQTIVSVDARRARVNYEATMARAKQASQPNSPRGSDGSQSSESNSPRGASATGRHQSSATPTLLGSAGTSLRRLLCARGSNNF